MKARLVTALAALAGAVVVMVAPAGPARACSCVEFTIESAVEESVAAFVGFARDEHGDAPRGWTFDVAEVVKGELPEQIEVWQAGRGECGPGFEIGELVGVVLRRDGDRYITDECGGVWLADELRNPGAVAAPTGSGPVTLIAAGRSGPAMLASFDAGGNLAAWGLGDTADDLSNLRVCPGSRVFVGTTFGRDDEPQLVRRDVATLAPIESVTLPQRSPESQPSITDTRSFDCTSPDGNVVFLVSASGYDDNPADNVVVWVDDDSPVMHPVDHGWGLAPASDGTSAFLLTGEHGTHIERITLTDGTRQPVAELPDGLGGRDIAVHDATGRLAVIATSNPTLDSRGDPAAPDDRLIVLGPDGTVQSTTALPAPRLVQSVDWLDADQLLIVWSLPSTIVEIATLDGTVLSSLVESAADIAVAGDHVFTATQDGVAAMSLDGRDRRLLTPSIARVHDIVAVPAGPDAAPQPTPTIPTASPSPSTSSTATPLTPPPTPPTTSPTSDPPGTTVAADVVAESSDSDDGAGDAIGVLIVAVGAVIAAATVIVLRRRRHLHVK